MEEIAEWDFWLESGVCSAKDTRRMLDAEFVSELAVLALEGEQNKKDSLNDYYTLYARQFGSAEQEKIKSLFKGAITEVRHVVPSIKKTRWKKRSDFYTLFGYLTLGIGELPLPSTARAMLRKKLAAFNEEVSKTITQLKRSNEDPTPGQSAVMDYVWAVEKAASDLNRRRTRRTALARFVEGAGT